MRGLTCLGLAALCLTANLASNALGASSRPSELQHAPLLAIEDSSARQLGRKESCPEKAKATRSNRAGRPAVDESENYIVPGAL